MSGEPAGYAPAPPVVVTVLGALAPQTVTIADAHGHIWIDAVPGAQGPAPVLDDFAASRSQLVAFRAAGGNALVDCQPGYCGRDGRQLARLDRETGVHILSGTGFHLRKYYAPGSPPWTWTAEKAGDYFLGELTEGLEETRQTAQPSLAGFIKVACEARLEDSPRHLLEAAAQASCTISADGAIGPALEVHTERGQDAEAIVEFFLARGVGADRLVLCHMDKRPDLGLQRALAGAGVMLEYDTFFRPKYNPEQNLWPLLMQMLEQNLAGSVALAADFADRESWQEPGMAGWARALETRLTALGVAEPVRQQLLGGNIATRLARTINH